MADVRPFRALRYAPSVDLALAICPPYDVISPEQQRALHRRSPHNAVHIEMAPGDGDRYQRAADALHQWLRDGVLQRDASPAFYLYRQEFQHDGRSYERRLLFGRLRLEEWERGIILPHEGTFGAPKEDRLRLLRATRVNTSPVYLIYRDEQRRVGPLLDSIESGPSLASFSDPEGQTHVIWRIDDPDLIAVLPRAFESEKLYVADGHHRYETALTYRDERRATAASWTGEEPENFALAALTWAQDPGLLVLPIHRLVNVDTPVEQALKRLRSLFHVQAMPSDSDLLAALAASAGGGPTFGVAAAPGALYLLSLADPDAVASLMPPERSAAWRQLDYAIATHAIIRHGLGLQESQLSDIDVLWYTEDAGQALEAVRAGQAAYTVLLNPVPVDRILAVADSGERMPQKSTFFYPKAPTGLVFNPLFAGSSD